MKLDKERLIDLQNRMNRLVSEPIPNDMANHMNTIEYVLLTLIDELIGEE